MLREHDTPRGANITLIGQVARFALHAGYHVIVEGILYSAHYGPPAAHRHPPGPSRFYYLDVPFEETMARHATRPQAAEFGLAEMQSWYRDRDLLPGAIEQIIGAASTLNDTVQRIMRDTGLVTCPSYAERRAREPAT